MLRIPLALLLALAACSATGCAHYLGMPLGDRIHIIRAKPDGPRETAIAENERGLVHLEADRLPKAEEAFVRAIAADNNYGPAHNNLGRVFFCQKRYYDAAREFRAAQQLIPNHPEPPNNLGLVYETVNQLEDAADHYAIAYTLAPQHPEIIGNYCRILLRRGQRDDFVRQLLADLILYDTRPDWTCWARETQAHLGTPPQGAVEFETLPEPPMAGPAL